MRHVEAAVADNTEVLRTGVRLDTVVIHIANVIADDVARHRHHRTVRPAFRIPVGSVIDSVVEVLHPVVCNHMP